MAPDKMEHEKHKRLVTELRSERVVCSGSTSDPVNVTSDVPQGTVLGPLFYSIILLMLYSASTEGRQQHVLQP